MKVESGSAQQSRVRVQWAESCQSFVAESVEAPFERWALGATVDEALAKLDGPDCESEVQQMRALQAVLYAKLSRVGHWDSRAESWYQRYLGIGDKIREITYRKLQPVMMWEEMQ